MQRRILLITVLLLLAPSPSAAHDAKPDWETWWADHCDDLLRVKAAVKRLEHSVSTKSSAHFGGRRRRDPTPLEREIRDEVVPALRRLFAEPSMPVRPRSAALIALARSGGYRRNLDLYFGVIQSRSGEAPELVEAAVIALGIHQLKSPEIRDLLIEVADDRVLSARVRCFAMISLGLLEDNSPEVYECLARRMDLSEPEGDLQACALLADGLIGDNVSVPRLRGWLREGRIGPRPLSDLLCAHLVEALSRIGDPVALPEIFEVLRSGEPHARRSAAMAVGGIVPQAEEEAQLHRIQEFRAHLDIEQDLWVQAYGLVALGQIGYVNWCIVPVWDACLAGVLDNRSGRCDITVRPFREAALGLLAHGSLLGERSDPASYRTSLTQVMLDDAREWEANEKALRSCCLSLHLVLNGRRSAAVFLTRLLRDTRQPIRVRGAAAIARSHARGGTGRADFFDALEERPLHRDFLLDLTVGAALNGEREMPARLIAMLSGDAMAPPEMDWVVEALGHFDDERSIPVLLSIVDPGRIEGLYPERTRTNAIEALGQISDRRDTPVLFCVSTNLNRPAAPEAVRELLRHR